MLGKRKMCDGGQSANHDAAAASPPIKKQRSSSTSFDNPLSIENELHEITSHPVPDIRLQGSFIGNCLQEGKLSESLSIDVSAEVSGQSEVKQEPGVEVKKEPGDASSETEKVSPSSSEPETLFANYPLSTPEDQALLEKCKKAVRGLSDKYLKKEARAAKSSWEQNLSAMSPDEPIESRHFTTIDIDKIGCMAVEGVEGDDDDSSSKLKPKKKSGPGWYYVLEDEEDSEISMKDPSDTSSSTEVKQEESPVELPQFHQRKQKPPNSVKCKETKQFIQIQDLPKCESLPVMFSYLTCNRNFRADEEPLLQNVPYTGDEIDTKFLTELQAIYRNKISQNAEIRALPDQLYVDSVDYIWDRVVPDRKPAAAAAARRPTLLSPNSREPAGAGAELPPDKVLAVLGTLFQWNELEDMRDRYVSKKNEINQSRLINNIDDVTCPELSREQSSSTYTMLFCRRCLVFDCQLHHNLPPRGPQKSDLPNCIKPCDVTNCYMHFYPSLYPPSAEESSSETSSPLLSRQGSIDSDSALSSSQESSPQLSPSKKSQPKDVPLTVSLAPEGEAMLGEDCDWANYEVTILNQLIPMFKKNICHIAACFPFRTCKQVYEKIQQLKALELFSPPNTSGTSVSNSLSGPLRKHHHKTRTKPAKKLPQVNPVTQKKLLAQKGMGKVANYVPCVHEAAGGEEYTCGDSCSCTERTTFCEKYCSCGPSCPQRFAGCRCRNGCNTKSCLCFLANRECDPDLCSRCGADDLAQPPLAPQPGGGVLATGPSCKNVNLQRQLRKHIMMAKSDVAGWGAFAKDPIEKNEFIAEYTGELISQDEAERRGKIYDKYNSSYLFNLNNDFCVDATRKGNKIRFANHSVNPNCFARVLMVCGDHRIGIFAKRDIKAGEELFFDYRYGPTEQLKYVAVERNKHK